MAQAEVRLGHYRDASAGHFNEFQTRFLHPAEQRPRCQHHHPCGLFLGDVLSRGVKLGHQAQRALANGADVPLQLLGMAQRQAAKNQV